MLVLIIEVSFLSSRSMSISRNRKMK